MGLHDVGRVEDYRSMIRQMFDVFDGSFDLALIEMLVVTILDAVNRSWIEKVIPALSGPGLKGPNGDELPDVCDLSVYKVNELIQWAERLQYTPGLVHGERRKAAGIEMIRRGIEVLRGKVSTPDDMKPHKRAVSP